MRSFLFLVLCMFMAAGVSAPVSAGDDLDELTAIISGSKSAGTSASPVLEKRWKCTIENQMACQKGNCNDIHPGDWLELDFIAGTYARCNEAKGCKQFPMVVNTSGDFIVAALPENGVTFKASEKDSSFSEAASIAGVVVNSFGKCSAVTGDIPAAHKPTGKKQKEARRAPSRPTTARLPVTLNPSPRSLSTGYTPFEASAAPARHQPPLAQW